MGALDYLNQVADLTHAATRPVFVPIELTIPGFIESCHLIFCAVVGIGSFVLLWGSLSEQRGYRGSTDNSVTRGWQPIARARQEPTT